MFGIFSHPKKVGDGRAVAELSTQTAIRDVSIGSTVIVVVQATLANATYSIADLTLPQDREPHHVRYTVIL